MVTFLIFVASMVISFGIFRPGIATKRFKSKYYTGETQDRIFYTLFFGIMLSFIGVLIGQHLMYI